jgi:hypothetical protein
MMSPPARSRISHPLRWLLGTAGSAALAVGLFIVLSPVALLQNAANHMGTREQAEAEQDRASAVTALERLRAAAADGELTNAEITNAAGRLWSAKRTPDHLHVTTGYRVTFESPDCWAVDLTLPLGPASSSSLTKPSPCPTGPAVAPT